MNANALTQWILLVGLMLQLLLLVLATPVNLVTTGGRAPVNFLSLPRRTRSASRNCKPLCGGISLFTEQPVEQDASSPAGAVSGNIGPSTRLNLFNKRGQLVAKSIPPSSVKAYALQDDDFADEMDDTAAGGDGGDSGESGGSDGVQDNSGSFGDSSGDDGGNGGGNISNSDAKSYSKAGGRWDQESAAYGASNTKTAIVPNRFLITSCHSRDCRKGRGWKRTATGIYSEGCICYAS